MKFILVTLACLLWATALKAETLTLKGTVTDRENGTPLVGATVLDIVAKKGCTTDSRGEFTLTAGYTGYASDTLTTDGRSPIRFRLQQNNWLPNLTMYGLSQDFGVNSSQMSAVELPASEIRSIPAFLGEPDVLSSAEATRRDDGKRRLIRYLRKRWEHRPEPDYARRLHSLQPRAPERLRLRHQF